MRLTIPLVRECSYAGVRTLPQRRSILSGRKVRITTSKIGGPGQRSRFHFFSGGAGYSGSFSLLGVRAFHFQLIE